MADHLDFIQIRGLESSDDEVFQGIGGASLSTSTIGGTPPEPQTDPEAFDLSDLWNELFAWMGQPIDDGEPETPRSLGRSRALLALPPFAEALARRIVQIPGPGPEQRIIEQGLITFIQEIIQQQFENIDRTSERRRFKQIKDILNDIDDHLKTALIWEDGILGIDKSILRTSLMEGEASLVRIGIDDQRASLQDLKAAIESLQYNDEEIVIGDLHAYLRSKVVEY